MTAPRRYPVIRTVSDGYIRVEVTYTEGAAPVVGCGETWCSGACGLPAVVIPAGEHAPCELKMRSSMVAFGPVMQPWAVTWTGARIEVPEEHRADFVRRYWR